jgi:RHS repeat-associated protein
VDNQSAGNYEYDAIGNLIKDNSADINSIKWNVHGKVSQIIFKNGDNIAYTYDAGGNRISKVVTKSFMASVDTTWYVRDLGGRVMSVYTAGNDSVNNGHLSQIELHIYGSQRIGMLKTQLDVAKDPTGNDTAMALVNKGYKYDFVRGNKIYELCNQLGNVLVTLNDKKLGVSSNNNTVDYYNPQIVSSQDYYPFGMLQPGRGYNAGGYRYGFNGHEFSNEIKGVGNMYNADFWEYDPRLGRRWNIDPVVKEYESPYQAFENNPINLIDEDGLTATDPEDKAGKDKAKTLESVTVVGRRKKPADNDPDPEPRKKSKPKPKPITDFSLQAQQDRQLALERYKRWEPLSKFTSRVGNTTGPHGTQGFGSTSAFWLTRGNPRFYNSAVEGDVLGEITEPNAYFQFLMRILGPESRFKIGITWFKLKFKGYVEPSPDPNRTEDEFKYEAPTGAELTGSYNIQLGRLGKNIRFNYEAGLSTGPTLSALLFNGQNYDGGYQIVGWGATSIHRIEATYNNHWTVFVTGMVHGLHLPSVEYPNGIQPTRNLVSVAFYMGVGVDFGKRKKSYQLLLPLDSMYKSQNYFVYGYDEYLYGDLNRSIALFDMAISRNEEMAKSYMYRAAAKMTLGRLSEALHDLNVSRALDPSIPELNYFYGKYYLLMGGDKLALNYYNQFLLKDPSNSMVYNERAIIKIRLKDFAGSIDDENKAIAIEPGDQSYFTNRGFAKLNLRMYRAAISDFNLSISIKPGHKAYANRGYAYQLLGAYKKAIADYTSALKLMPADGEIYYRRSISLRAIGKIHEADDDLSKSKEMGYEPQKNGNKVWEKRRK